MEKNINPNQYYTTVADTLSVRLKCLRRYGRMFMAGEIITFAMFITFLAVYAMAGVGSWAVLAALLSLAVYVAVRRYDERNDALAEHVEAQIEVCRRELMYLRGDFSAFDDGARYVDADHPYTFDIDVFGGSSLFQRINRTVTTGGADRLASLLRQPETGSIGERADAVEALAAEPEWRRLFVAEGVGGSIDTGSVTRALHDIRNVRVPAWIGSPLALAASIVMLAGFYVSVALAILSDVPSSLAVVWGLVVLATVLASCHGKLMEISRVTGRLHRQTTAYVRVVRLIGSLHTGDALLGRLAETVAAAVPSFHGIGRILKSLDRRGNVLALIIFDIFLMSDFFLLRRFVRWQRRYGDMMDGWIESVSEVDALVSMATMRYNEPRAVRAEIVADADGRVVYEARGLAHPFLGTKAVGNDFSIADNNYYIITGANMAGKSTFLRSLGINWLLAMNGMPVFARSLRLSVFPLFTSMRTTDDLSRGISYFNAELRRLHQLIDFQSSHSGALIILDEILKGTNSVDKLNGSRLFLEYMSRRHVTGVVATHDLELSRLAESQPERFHNFCFEIELGTDVTYSYSLTPGVARNQNATFLLRALLK